jgi:putative oxidoreductase
MMGQTTVRGSGMTSDLFLLLARILLSVMFLVSGFDALADIEGTGGYFAGLGLPLPGLLTWIVGVFEIVAGILLVIGLQTRITAVVLALFSAVASYLGHFSQGGNDPMMAFMHAQAFLKDIAVAGGMIALAIDGAGKWSLDAWVRGRGDFRQSPR